VKKGIALLGLAGSLTYFLLASSALGATNAGGCELKGSASFSPGLTNTAQNFAYSFTGNLSNCQSSSGGPSSGTVFAGTNGLPLPSGNGGCANSTTGGITVVQWSDGTTTVVQYSTTGALAAVALQGTVIASVTSSTGTTYTTTRYAGDTAAGALAFEPPEPTACTGAGVTTAGIEGVVGLGSS
jgi:hypothetical protein